MEYIYNIIKPDPLSTYDVTKIRPILAAIDNLHYLREFVEFCTLRVDNKLHWLLTPGGIAGWMQWHIHKATKDALLAPRKKQEPLRRRAREMARYVRELQQCGVSLATVPDDFEGGAQTKSHQPKPRIAKGPAQVPS